MELLDPKEAQKSSKQNEWEIFSIHPLTLMIFMDKILVKFLRNSDEIFEKFLRNSDEKLMKY